VKQARRELSSDETDWSSEQRHEVEMLINDIEQLRDLVCNLRTCSSLFNVCLNEAAARSDCLFIGLPFKLLTYLPTGNVRNCADCQMQ